MPNARNSTSVLVLATLLAMTGCATPQRAPLPAPLPGDSVDSQLPLPSTDNGSDTGATEDNTAAPVQPESPAQQIDVPDNAQAPVDEAAPLITTGELRIFSEPTKAGVLQHPDLTEVSGIVSSVETPGVLFAINDSGNASTLYALREDGQHIASWQTSARNRDWEDMAKTTLNGNNYLIVGDTGDNLKVHRQSTLYLFAEPSFNAPLADTLPLAFSIPFTFEDGPRNVEAFAVTDNIVYLISKEPVTAAGPQASRLYTLPLAELPAVGEQVAQFAGELPVKQPNLEARLAASLAGVDLNHPTALGFDAAGNNAYLLTYREVMRFTRNDQKSWPEVFAQGGTRIHAHTLEQAEALSVDSGRAVFFTSENASAPLWALPLTPPL